MELSHLNALLCSNYLYSASIGELEEADSFISYNAGINFAVKADSEIGVNADVVMQTKEAEYTDLIYWKAERMMADEVAVSGGIAKKYKLKAGDYIYSKSVVDGKIREYLIVQILPDVTALRIKKGQNFTDGVIVMGYDSNYADNVSHSVVMFTDADIDYLSKKSAGTLTDIIYRDDEIKDVCMGIVPYFVILELMSVVSAILFTIINKKNIEYNFRRLVLVGFSQKRLNSSLFFQILGMGIVSIVIYTILSLVFCKIVKYSVMFFILWGSIAFTEYITLLLVALVIKRQLWR